MSSRTPRPTVRRALALALVAALLGGVAVVGSAGPASAAGPERFDIVGHGNGHGRGMGQYGARGYADAQGWSHTQILDHFYGGTTAGSVSPGQPITVLLCDQEGVVICSQGSGVQTLYVTSGADFYVEGNLVPAGNVVQNQREPNGTWRILQSPGGCGLSGPWTAVGGGSSLDAGIDFDSTVGAPTAQSQMLEICSPKRRTYRGVLDHVLLDGKPRITNFVGIDDHIKGVVPAEMPNSWNPAALRAQAVAARSYAASEGNRFTGANTCDTIQCQVYLGFGTERPTTNDAIAATSGQVRRMPNGSVARTEFSSSTGGHTTGGTFPAVADAGDGVASNSNPHHTWSVQLESSRLEGVYAIGDLLQIEVLERNGLGPHGDGGRVKRVRLVGSSTSVEITGDAFRSAAGLRSDWFTATPVAPTTPTTAPTTPPTTPGSPQPVTDLQWYLRSSATAGNPTAQAVYGGPGYTPISCDWDNDGDDTLGVYVNGEWYLRDAVSNGAPNRSFSFGGPGYVPVCGDWNGDGQDSIGVYAGDGMWYLRNDVGPGQPHITFQYGYAAGKPVVGNWDGSDAAVEVGVFESGSWMLRNNVGPGSPERNAHFGYAGAVPVIGDWNGDGYDGFGVYDRGSWMLREWVSEGSADRSFTYGYAGTVPVPGRWSPSADGVGVVD